MTNTTNETTEKKVYAKTMEFIKGAKNDKLDIGIGKNKDKTKSVMFFSLYPLKKDATGKVITVNKLNPINKKYQDYPTFNYEKTLRKQLNEDKAIILNIFMEGFLGLSKTFLELKEVTEYNGYYQLQILGNKTQIDFKFKKDAPERTTLIGANDYNKIMYISAKKVENGKIIGEAQTNINYLECSKIKFLVNKFINLSYQQYIQ